MQGCVCAPSWHASCERVAIVNKTGGIPSRCNCGGGRAPGACGHVNCRARTQVHNRTRRDLVSALSLISQRNGVTSDLSSDARVFAGVMPQVQLTVPAFARAR